MIFCKIKALLRFVLIILVAFQFNSCSSVKNKDGETIFQNQQRLKSVLENLAEEYDNYSLEAFSRRTQIRFPSKRSKLFVHSFYLIKLNDEDYHTLSFANSKFVFSSEGAWLFDKESDRTSYKTYIEGHNKWNVVNLFPGKIINVKTTLKNIIETINSGVEYYYKDHLKPRPNALNCNTALYETILFIE